MAASISSSSASGCRSRSSTTWAAAGSQRLDVPGLEQEQRLVESHRRWRFHRRRPRGFHRRQSRLERPRCTRSKHEPVTMYVKDFDGNGVAEQIISVYKHGVSYPLPLRDDLLQRAADAQAALSRTTRTTRRKTVDGHLHEGSWRRRWSSARETFATTLVRNNGDGTFTLVPLPDEAQLAPVYGILPHGRRSATATPTCCSPAISTGSSRRSAAWRELRPAAAGRRARRRSRPCRAPESGFFVPGQARDIPRVRTAAGDAIIVARNNDRPLIFRAATTPRGVATRGAPTVGR